MPMGCINVAELPTPSAWPAAVPPELLPPASVETARVAITIVRMRLLTLSTTKRLPRLSTATPVGEEKSAMLPMPSARPLAVPELPPPASVDTAPAAMTMARTQLLLRSET